MPVLCNHIPKSHHAHSDSETAQNPNSSIEPQCFKRAKGVIEPYPTALGSEDNLNHKAMSLFIQIP